MQIYKAYECKLVLINRFSVTALVRVLGKTLQIQALVVRLMVFCLSYLPSLMFGSELNIRNYLFCSKQVFCCPCIFIIIYLLFRRFVISQEIEIISHNCLNNFQTLLQKAAYFTKKIKSINLKEGGHKELSSE